MKKLIKVNNKDLPTIPWETLKKDYTSNALKQKKNRDVGGLKTAIITEGFDFPLYIWEKGKYIIDGAGRMLALELCEYEGWEIPPIPYVLVEATSKAHAKKKVLLASSMYGKIDGDSAKRFLSGTDDEVSMLDMDLSMVEIGIDMQDIDLELLPDGDEEDKAPEEGYVPEIPTKATTKRGEMFKLGDHVLMCGDSTVDEDVTKLMGGVKADMVFTDPPYALFGNSTGVSGVTDDKMTRPFFLQVFKMMKTHTKLFAHLYTCCDWHSAFSLQSMAREMELKEKNLCIWDKGDGGIGAAYQMCYEMIWFHANSPVAKKTIGKTITGERVIHGKPNIWRFKRVTKNREHNAQKPVEMISFAVENSSEKGDIVLDLFGGSGSTLIACENTNRKCRIMEIDERYCDVIIARWESLTGKKAKKI